MVTKTTALACAIFTLAFTARAGSIDSDLIEAMKNAAETNKTVSREEWLEGIETLADSLLKSEAALSPDGGNEKIYFSGIKNALTSGNEHKFIEDRLCELLKNGSAEIFGRDSDSPFPPEPESLSLKGSIENASAIIGGAKVPGVFPFPRTRKKRADRMEGRRAADTVGFICGGKARCGATDYRHRRDNEDEPQADAPPRRIRPKADCNNKRGWRENHSRGKAQDAPVFAETKTHRDNTETS